MAKVLPHQLVCKKASAEAPVLAEGYLERKFPRRVAKNREKRFKHQASLATIQAHFPRKYRHRRHCYHRRSASPSRGVGRATGASTADGCHRGTRHIRRHCTSNAEDQRTDKKFTN